ncbi:hypothetical protein BV22DRAFT_1046327 [Leucogyrophana mollusca]|uniref:Uncharacterized protein n=1 Tax=Leucogyrophana mollusca TaxID=85980 RepID=A0ACB8BLU8_9AGAM|nr:hypothetical protein BV22DRAFT_1046327 [Leucogyrophana mollusca]
MVALKALASLASSAVLVAASYCELPSIGKHGYRIDVWDGENCHKHEHHETFYGTWPALWPASSWCFCNSIAPALVGKVKSFTVANGHIPIIATALWTGHDCTGEAITRKHANWIDNNVTGDRVHLRSFRICMVP